MAQMSQIADSEFYPQISPISTDWGKDEMERRKESRLYLYLDLADVALSDCVWQRTPSPEPARSPTLVLAILAASFSRKAIYFFVPIRRASADSSSLTRQTSGNQSVTRIGRV